VQVFAPDIFVAARMGRVEAGQALWKRLAYVAITRAAQELRWVVANRLARPRARWAPTTSRARARRSWQERTNTDSG
jgi:CelD/BcsL family acetyltransferase involved in cellulose biosynthesis